MLGTGPHVHIISIIPIVYMHVHVYTYSFRANVPPTCVLHLYFDPKCFHGNGVSIVYRYIYTVTVHVQ